MFAIRASANSQRPGFPIAERAINPLSSSNRHAVSVGDQLTAPEGHRNVTIIISRIKRKQNAACQQLRFGSQREDCLITMLSQNKVWWWFITSQGNNLRVELIGIHCRPDDFQR